MAFLSGLILLLGLAVSLWDRRATTTRVDQDPQGPSTAVGNRLRSGPKTASMEPPPEGTSVAERPNDAKLHVEIVGAPTSAASWLTIEVRQRHDRGTSVLSTASTPTPMGSASVPLSLYSGEKYLVRVYGNGVSVFYPTLVRVLPGEQTVQFDLSTSATLSGRIYGLPWATNRDRRIQASFLASDLEGSPQNRVKQIIATTGDDGEFAFRGLPEGSVQLSLFTEDGSVSLVELESNQSSWHLKHGLETNAAVHPKSQILGIKIANEYEVPESRFSVGIDRRPFSPSVQAGGIALLNAASFNTGKVLLVRTDSWISRHGISDLPEPEGSVVLVDSYSPATGSIRVLSDPGPSACVAVAFLVGNGFRGHPIEGKPTADGWLMSGLDPGGYTVAWRWEGAFNVLQEDFRVVEGQESILKVLAPRTRFAAGYLSNWSQIPSPIRPHGITIGEARASILADGTFEIPVFLPVSDLPTFIGPQGEKTTAANPPEYDSESNTLSVSYPTGMEAVEILVDPILEKSRFFAEYLRPGSMPKRVNQFTPVKRVHPRKGGRLLLKYGGESFLGWVWEFTAEEKILRGWFTIDGNRSSIRVSDPGRYLSIEFEPKVGLAQLHLGGPRLDHGDCPPILVANLDLSSTNSVWIPLATENLLIQAAGYQDQVIDLRTTDVALKIALDGQK